MRKPIIAGNWKMHNTREQAVTLVEQVKPLVSSYHQVEIVVCPPFTALTAVLNAVSRSNIAVGAQNMHWEDKGAFTGEISPIMLKDLGCRYCIIGHSERRQYFAETDATVNRKVKAALHHGLVPIVCVGESLEQREAGRTEMVVQEQVEQGLAGLSPQQVSGIVLAYEPIWAIGTGKTASPQDAQQVIKHIRRVLANMFGIEASGKVRILYGGSVKPGNIKELMEQIDIDGALVGGASLKAEDFAAIVNYSG